MSMPSFCDLPDELLLEIVRSLDAIRSFETQATAFRRKSIEKERQRENHLRKRTLHSLCLTSRRLRLIATPTLYASSCTCATRSGLRQLQLLHRTLNAPERALGQTNRLAGYLLYIENRLADFKGNSLGNDKDFLQEWFATYTRLLSELTLSAPNIEHLCVVSVESEDAANQTSLWEAVLSRAAHVTHGGLAKLKVLSTQFNMLYASRRMPICHRLLQHMKLLPELSTLQISGAQLPDISENLQFGPGSMQTICRLDLTECWLGFDWVADLLLASQSLQHFNCRWSYMMMAEHGPSEMLNALLACTDTLETLSLDWRAMTFEMSDGNLLGSLRGMKRLRTLHLCEYGFLSNCPVEEFYDYPFELTEDYPVEYPGGSTFGYAESSLAELLPNHLEHLALYPVLDKGDLSQAEILWDFSDECATLVPSLETLCIKMHQEVSPEVLTRAFGDAGVQLHIEPGETY